MSNLRDFDSHICYVPFYMPEENPSYSKPNKDFILEAWECIKTINPNLKDEDLISSHCNRYKYAQPVCNINYKNNLPSKEPFKRIFIVDTNFYYPEDRGISESIKFGRSLVRKYFSNYTMFY